MKKGVLYSEQEILARLREKSPAYRYRLVQVGTCYELRLERKVFENTVLVHTVLADGNTVRKLIKEGKAHADRD